jgi:sugar lactone lactonase YvrE
MSDVRLAAATCNILGEGPVWDAARGRLYWVDIKGGRLHWLHPASGVLGDVAVEGQVSSVAPRASGQGLLAARQDGVGVLDPDTGEFTHRFDPEPERPGNRANDGNVDLAGRYWFGTMHDGELDASGAIYRLDPDWSCRRVLDGIGISNTLVVGPNNDVLYVADSLLRIIDALAVDPVTGEPGTRSSLIRTRGPGGPDGSTVDAEGFVWNAQWGGARLVRYSPAGEIDRIVPLPIDHPSSCAFGGEDLATIYITTARWLLSDEALARQPWAGALLAFEPGVRGLALPPFGG